MKLLVIGGTHGNEMLGIQLVKLLQDMPIDDVDTLIGNHRAVAVSQRFIETDLNRSFGVDGSSYEMWRAREIERLIAQYDMVFDFHNTQTPNNNCSFVGPSSRKDLQDVSVQFGLNRCIVATYDCINKQCDNVLSIEISIGDEVDSAAYWYEKIKTLAANQLLPDTSRRLQLYRFAGRCTWQQKEEIGIDALMPFQQLPTCWAKELGYRNPVYPIFIGSMLTEYYATFLEKITEKEIKS